MKRILPALLLFGFSFILVSPALFFTRQNVYTADIPPGTPLRIFITGPSGEDKNNLPSVNADARIWYNVTVKGLEPNKGHHLKIYLTESKDDPTEKYSPTWSNNHLNDHYHVEGTESLCGYVFEDGHTDFSEEAISNDAGEIINARMRDSLLPDGKHETGNFIFEVATSNRAGIWEKDCVRDTGVGFDTITIIETPEDYDPKPSGDSGQPGTFDITKDPGPVTSAAVVTILNFAIGMAGGVAFLLMIFGSYRLIFAGGNPESIQRGGEVITAAIIGLLVIVFSVLILRFLGIAILGIL